MYVFIIPSTGNDGMFLFVYNNFMGKRKTEAAMIHTAILVITIAFSFLFAKTNLALYDVQISAFLFIILFLAKRFVVPEKPRSRLLESVILTFIILSVVNSTGGVSSSYFFLIYFLLFSLAFLLEPIISITVTLTLIIFYLLNIPEVKRVSDLMPILSFAFVSPFALYLGEEYIDIKAEKQELNSSKEKTYLFLSLIIKNHAQAIIEAVDNFTGDNELLKIKKHAMRVKGLIDKFEKSKD